MKKIGKGVILLAMFLLFIPGLGVQPIEAAEPEITLRYAGNLPINHFITRSQQFYAKRVMEKANGKVKIEVYPAGQLFTDKDMLRALPSGAVDMGEVFCPQWTGIVPLWIFWDLPLYFENRAHWYRVADTEVGEIMKQEPLDKNAGFKVLYWMHSGGTGFASKMPLKTLEDFKGKRIRGVGEIVLEGIKALGGAPVFMGGGEVYMALQRGTIDGANSLIASFWKRKYYEVTKYISSHDWNFGMAVTLINKKKWDSLPADVQKVMLEVAEEAKMWTRKESDKEDEESLVGLKEKGMDIFDLRGKERARWREASKPLQDYYVQRAGEKAKMVLEMGEKVR
jgi:tripartite ATP-independent transporter DctP family solute receptor